MFDYLDAQAFNNFTEMALVCARRVGDDELAALAEEAQLLVGGAAPFAAASHAVARLVGELRSRERDAEEAGRRGDERVWHTQTVGVEAHWMKAWRFARAMSSVRR